MGGNTINDLILNYVECVKSYDLLMGPAIREMNKYCLETSIEYLPRLILSLINEIKLLSWRT
jgi:hypothetical protein